MQVPKHSPSTFTTRIEAVAWCALALGTVFYWLLSINTLPYGPDSWFYYELSQSLFSDDYFRVHGVRQFQSTEPYSMSFPPLWPICIAAASAAWPLGPGIMSTLTTAVFVLMITILEIGFRQRYQQPGIGLITGLGLLCLSPYLDVLKSGGSLPLSLLLLVLICFMWLQQPSPRNALTLGLLAGLTLLLRFDAAPAVVAVLIVYLGRGLHPLTARNQARDPVATQQVLLLALPYLLAVALAMSPYVIYSLNHFDKVWASDNSVVALSVQAGAFVTDFYQNWPATALQQPSAFISKVVSNSGPFARTTLFNFLLPLLLLAWLYLKLARKTLAPKAKADTDHLLGLLLLLLLAWSATLAGYWLTGYDYRRYYLPEMLLLLIAAGIVFNCLQPKAKNTLLVVLLLLLGNEVVTQIDRADFNSDYVLRSEEQLHLDDATEAYTRCYQMLGAKGKIMFLDDDITASRIAALAKIDTTMMPMNLLSLAPEQMQLLVERFEIRAIVIPEQKTQSWRSWFEQSGFKTEACGDYPGFFQLQTFSSFN